jgi:predicted 3-demethylubiquinone-9 3-methyltransferase (glyoxalase superfamily)
MALITKLAINLWFETRAEEAANFYCSIFKNSSIGAISRYGKEGYEFHHMPEGSVMTIEFFIDGIRFIALNGGPYVKFNESISFVVNCLNEAELDYYWDKLTEGGDPEAQQCGWLKDKYGVSWQVTPDILSEWMTDPDKEKVSRVSQALFPMKKLDWKKLEDAYNGV